MSCRPHPTGILISTLVMIGAAGASCTKAGSNDENDNGQISSAGQATLDGGDAPSSEAGGEGGEGAGDSGSNSDGPPSNASADGASSKGSDENGQDSDGSGDSSSDPSPDSGEDDGNLPSFDVPGGSPGDVECEALGPGTHCRDAQTMVVCDDKGKQTEVKNCVPNFCQEELGCVICMEGQISCQGDRVMQCDTSVPGHQWLELAECNAAANETCDIKTGTCIPAAIIGGNVPTGKYYQYAAFTTADNAEIASAYDIDSYENRLYVSSPHSGGGTGATIKIFEVELLDSDGDGKMEPNQHPDNPNLTGPMEERLVSYIDTIVIDDEASLGQSVSEIYVEEDKIYYVGRVGGSVIVEYDLATGSTSHLTPPNSWSGAALAASMVGYDEINDVWYSASENPRGVKQYNAKTETWGWAFLYPDLAGSHMDGLEVVVAQSVDSEGRIQLGVPYVYVSDMTSDFIGQYRLDIKEGWVQENLFEYDGPEGALVEGMGFGALNHFWATSGNLIYELGGGDLTKYTEPVG